MLGLWMPVHSNAAGSSNSWWGGGQALLQLLHKFAGGARQQPLTICGVAGQGPRFQRFHAAEDPTAASGAATPVHKIKTTPPLHTLWHWAMHSVRFQPLQASVRFRPLQASTHSTASYLRYAVLQDSARAAREPGQLKAPRFVSPTDACGAATPAFMRQLNTALLPENGQTHIPDEQATPQHSPQTLQVKQPQNSQPLTTNCVAGQRTCRK